MSIITRYGMSSLECERLTSSQQFAALLRYNVVCPACCGARHSFGATVQPLFGLSEPEMNAGLFSLTLIIVPLSLSVMLRSCHRVNPTFVFLPDPSCWLVVVLGSCYWLRLLPYVTFLRNNIRFLSLVYLVQKLMLLQKIRRLYRNVVPISYNVL